MICVLLSTFNGADYLPTLLDSLIGQDAPGVSIIIRDDGSTDGTVEVLNARAERHKAINITTGPNRGVNHSIFELLTMVPDDCRYTAFCDQDDFWEPDKISRAVAMLSAQPPDLPVMYCSRLTISDENLAPISLTPLPGRDPGFANALAENIATGATIMLNRPAVDILTSHIPDIDQLEMYDWWIYQTISALGRVIIDDQSRILSRQHADNVVGLPFGRRRLRSKYRFLTNPDKTAISTQAVEFSRVFSSVLSDPDRRTLDTYLDHILKAGLVRRIRYALRGEVYRQRLSDDLLLKLRIILGKV